MQEPIGPERSNLSEGHDFWPPFSEPFGPADQYTPKPQYEDLNTKHERRNTTHLPEARARQSDGPTQEHIDVTNSTASLSNASLDIAHQAVSEQQDAFENNASMESRKTYPEQLSAFERLQKALNTENAPRLRFIWRLYEKVGRPASLRSQVLSRLADASDPEDLERAMQIYSDIPSAERLAIDYRHGAMIAVRLNNNLEDQICQESLNRGLGKPSCSFLLCHRISKHQWDKAASIWQSASRSPTADSNFTWWHDLHEHTDLPKHWLTLADTIGEPGKKQSLKAQSRLHLARHLSKRLFRSNKVMSSITAEGILAVIHALERLELLHASHLLLGISTLQKMPGSRLRIEFAMMLYRNFRLKFPDVCPAPSILGALIDIQTDAENSKPEHLKYILSEFEMYHGCPDPKAYQRSLTAFARMGHVDDVKTTFAAFTSHHGQPSNLTYLTPLIYVHAIVGDVNGAQYEFDRLHTIYGLQPTTYCWNIVLMAFARNRDALGAFQTFNAMLNTNIEPDARSFSTLMAICSSLGDTDAVHKLVDQARQLGIRGNVGMVQTLVEAYCKNGDPDSAENLLETIRSMSLKGSMTRGWNTLLRYHAFKVNTDDVLRIQDRMRKLQFSPDAMTYAVLMQSLIMLGRTSHALKILQSLHFNRQTDANFLHYVILAHGFLHEGDRDMVKVVCDEAMQRFSRSSFALNLTRLESLVQQDLTASRSSSTSLKVALRRSESFLLDLVGKIQQKDYATKSPQVGSDAGSRGLAWAFPLAYFRFIVNVYNRHGNYQKVEDLLALYRDSTTLDGQDTATRRNSLPLDLIAEQISAYARQKQFEKVDECWNEALSQAISLSTPLDLEMSTTEYGAQLLPRSVFEPPQPTYFDDTQEFEPLVTSSQDSTSSLSTNSRILPSQRYSLRGPLSAYILALTAQKRFSHLREVVGRVEKLGFALTGRNCNLYVQALTRSEEIEDQLHAFRVFDEKLADNLGAFNTSRVNSKRHQRLAKLNPSYYVPEFRTLLFLSDVLKRFRERRDMDGGAAVARLAEVTGKTSAFVSSTNALVNPRKPFAGDKNRPRRVFGILNQVFGGPPPPKKKRRRRKKKRTGPKKKRTGPKKKRTGPKKEPTGPKKEPTGPKKEPTGLKKERTGTSNMRRSYIRKPDRIQKDVKHRWTRQRSVLGGSSVEVEASSSRIASVMSSKGSPHPRLRDRFVTLQNMLNQKVPAKKQKELGQQRKKPDWAIKAIERQQQQQQKKKLSSKSIADEMGSIWKDKTYDENLYRRLRKPSATRAVLNRRIGDPSISI
ncbi:MAG: hypothetical protein Q9227_001618 [Pyrenula ochraceoflavens]